MSRLNDRARQLGETAAALRRGLDSADAGTGKDAELVFRTLQEELKIPPLEPKPGSARKT